MLSHMSPKQGTINNVCIFGNVLQSLNYSLSRQLKCVLKSLLPKYFSSLSFEYFP